MSGGVSYPRGLRVLHWLVALVVLPQWGLGLLAERVADPALSRPLLQLHFQLGMLVLALMLLRLGARLLAPGPSPPAGEPAWRWRLATGMHGLLYALLLVLPASGYVIWVWMDASLLLWQAIPLPVLFTPPAEETGRAIAWYVHVAAAWLLAALVLLHAAVACWHQWIRRDGLIGRRMRPY